jgi:peptidyl-prolyl cis-trans isomerase D
MLRRMRRGSRWLMWLVIVGVGGVFVLYLGIGGGGLAPAPPQTVVAVGDRSFDARDVLRVRRNQEEEYRRILGEGFDSEAAADFLDESAAAALMRLALLARQAEDMGLVVSDEEVRAYLRAMPGVLDEAGRVDRDAIQYYAERQFGSVRRFREALRDELLARKLSRLVGESVAISDAETLDSLRYQREEVSLAIVRLGSASADDLEPSEEEVVRVLGEESEEIRQAYEARRAEFDRPEQVRARHILVRIPEDGGEEAETRAEARAREILERIREGADFRDVALEVSEDPGSRPEGGDLGFFPRGRMVRAFEDVAFALEPGETSDVVRTVHGFHVIRVEERRPASVVSFEEAREQLARERARESLAREAARAKAEDLATAIREAKSLVEAAREQGIPIERTESIRRQPDGYIPGVGAAPEVMAAAFALDPSSPSDPRPHATREGDFVLIQLLERTTPSDEELVPLVAEERQRLLRERRQAMETAWVQQVRDRLAERGELLFDLTALRGRR